MSTEEKIIRNKVGLLKLSEMLGSVSEACKVMGYSLDSDGKERVRLEGYLPKADFTAALFKGLGRIAFVRKKYADAERWYG